MNPIVKSYKAIRELGLPKIWYYTVYQVGLRTGHYRRIMPSKRAEYEGQPGLPPYTNYPEFSPKHREQAVEAAEEVLQGQTRLFGGDPVPLDLDVGASEQHWSLLERKPPSIDIKFIWEPARFGWAVTLARAYAISGDPRYARDFWEKTHYFLEAHPPNLGRQWQSAQEVAIRLMVLVFCDRVFADAPSSTPKNRERLLQAVAEHALRIPPTLVYARAQNNNHLLSEAAGLLTAGLYLPEHPHAGDWVKSGWQWLNWCFQNQIDEFGTYTQHSTNYHRLMLQIALYADHLRRLSGSKEWRVATRARLDAATRWLWALTDPDNGRVPNLGANDGAYIFPLASQPFQDYRPVVDAAAKAFLDQDLYGSPELAEMAAWFDCQADDNREQKQSQAPDFLRVPGMQGRAFLHTAHYHDRPSHADQLHADLWWRGVNIALDPGTYQYNAPQPWQNALSVTGVHNTLTLDGQDQMLRASRFLWLDWAQAEIVAHTINEYGELNKVTAEHDGYRKLDARHQRTLLSKEDGWIVIDSVFPLKPSHQQVHRACLTWLLPDWPYTIEAKNLINIQGPQFAFRLEIKGAQQLNIFRAGECLNGNLPSRPAWGWSAPNYGQKKPALMLLADQKGPLPLTIESNWRFEA